MRSTTTRRTAVWLGCTLLLGAAACGREPRTQEARAAASDAPVAPPSVGTYPSGSDQVEGWIAAQDSDAIRAHAWDVWTSITSPTSVPNQPVWETWYSGYEVYQMDSASLARGRRHLHDFETPRQLGHAHRVGAGLARAIPQFPAEAVTSFNRYSTPLAQFIWTKRYNDANVLNGINARFDQEHTPVAQRLILSSADSVAPGELALKPVFQFVSGTQVTALPYWGGDNSAASSDSLNPTPGSWKQGVAVDPTGRLRPGSKVWMSVNGNPPDSLTVVPLSAFYHFTLTAADSAAYSQFAASSGDDVGAGNQGATDSVLKMVRPGNLALLMAMHVTTKEIPNWTWQTFWWSPGTTRFSRGRPARLPEPWSHYDMNAAYYMVTPPGAAGGTPHVVYNPYLETNLFGYIPGPGTDSTKWTGIESNCMSCHRMAAWKVLACDTCFPETPDYRPNGQINPADSTLFAGYTKLDFLWSITRAQLRPQYRAAARAPAATAPPGTNAR
ncbi:MAG: hypothetical protein JWM27_978 [Gemmatimonadetes bacterium]|nr:hypothetical protein [Gemmatimonadota bacterium]